jgi:hypothetical protein
MNAILLQPLAFTLPLMRGEVVRRAQLALLRAGLHPGEPDGVYGPGTAEAVRRFQRREGLPVDGVVAGATWARLLQAPELRRERPWDEALRPFLPALTAPHGAPVGAGRLRWRLVCGGIVIEGEAAPRRSTTPRTAAAAWARHRAPLEAAARRFGVPVDLLLATALTESAGRADSVREEPGFVSDAATPHRVSTGLMQTLLSTAREALADPTLDRARLLEPMTSAMAGAAFLHRQATRGPQPTRFDPPLAAIAYNAGSLRLTREDNPWGLVQTRRGEGWHADAFCAFLGDAHALFAAGEAPDAATPSLWGLLDKA